MVVTFDGTEILVDERDMELVLTKTWRVTTPSPTGVRYAEATKYCGWIKMHNLIIQPPPGFTVDHADGNGLDNRRQNLRVATASQQSANRRVKAGSSSTYRGVSRHSQTGKWQVILQVDGRLRRFGLYHDEIEAALVADRVARQVYGEFARLNFPDMA